MRQRNPQIFSKKYLTMTTWRPFLCKKSPVHTCQLRGNYTKFIRFSPPRFKSFNFFAGKWSIIVLLNEGK